MAARKSQLKTKLLAEFEKTPVVQIACQRAGVVRQTYYRWRNEDPAFADKADEALSLGVDLINDLAESHLIKGIKDDKFAAIRYWLSHHHKTYKQAPHYGPPPSEQYEEDFSSYTDDELTRIIQADKAGEKSPVPIKLRKVRYP